MKTTKVLTRFTAVMLSVMLVMAALSTVAFAQTPSDKLSSYDALVGELGLSGDAELNVIVKFDSPSLLERNYSVGSKLALSYENKLIAEQDAVLDKLGLTPSFRYTGVINGVALTVTVDEIRQLENSRGVEGVYLTRTYEAPETKEIADYMMSASELIGAELVNDAGFTGDGVVVAVIDSGIVLEHEAFNNTKYVKNPRLTKEKLNELGFSQRGGYYNEKIPFYYDYINNSYEGHADAAGHGSHVSGIIGGYAENPDGSVKFSGIAPGTQICSMRVLDDDGRGTEAGVCAALEDAYKLGVDIVNLSLGSDSGFRLGDSYYLSYDGIFSILEDAGIMVICAAGNSGGMNLYVATQMLDETYMDYGTLGEPAIFPGNISVGSANNITTPGTVLDIDGKQYQYVDYYSIGGELSFRERFEGETFDIVYLATFGAEEDYASVDVSGKVVAVDRGTLSFTDKCQYAAAAGAAGLIVVNQADADMGKMSIDNQTIPAIMVEHDIVECFPLTDYTPVFTTAMVKNPLGGLISSFSSIGVTPDLEVGLDIVGIGGSVSSVDSETIDGYVTYDGTSMACPCVAGAYALIYEYYSKLLGDSADRVQIAAFIDDVTQSTANIMTDEDGYRYSPRVQGAGLIDVVAALSAEAYIANPIISLGYDKSASGKLTMEYDLVSLTGTDKEYYTLVSAITDNFSQVTQTDFKNTVTPFVLSPSFYSAQVYADGTAVGQGGTLKLPAGEIVNVKVVLEIHPSIVSQLLAIYPNGFFIDGFLELYDVNDLSRPAVHGSYISFVGDWLAAPAIEPITLEDIYEFFYALGVNPYIYKSLFTNFMVDANFSYTALLVGENGEYHIGQNPIVPAQYLPSHPDRFAISADISNADEALYQKAYMCPSFIRNCKSVEYVLTNSETGEVYARQTDEYVCKDVVVGLYQYASYSNFAFDATYKDVNERGEIVTKYIPSGTKVTVSVYTVLDHPDATQKLEAQYELTVDYVAPELEYKYDADTKQLTVSAYDSEYISALMLKSVDSNYNPDKLTQGYMYYEITPGLTYTEVFDLTGYTDDAVCITTADYAGNIVEKIISLESGDISNMEAVLDIEGAEGIEIELDGDSYLYGDVDFSVSPDEGYCFTDDFELLFNGTALKPVAVENGIYYYSVSVDSTENEITVNGVMKHDYVPTITKAATCLAEGELSHICSNCSNVGSVVSIEPHGHKEGSPVTVVEPTCTTGGLATVSCTECDALLRTEPVAAHNHSEAEFVTTKEPTCTESGLKTKVCKDCGAVLESEVIPAKGHTEGAPVTIVEPSCTEAGLATVSCTECGTIIKTEPVAAHNHSAAEFVTTKEPTCTESGLKTKVCKDCGAVLESEVIPAKGHTAGEPVVEKEASCTEAGLEVTKCADCGALLDAKAIPAKGHDIASGTEASAIAPAVCGACGESVGSADSAGITIASLVLSSISIAAIAAAAVVILVKKRR